MRQLPTLFVIAVLAVSVSAVGAARAQPIPVPIPPTPAPTPAPTPTPQAPPDNPGQPPDNPDNPPDNPDNPPDNPDNPPDNPDGTSGAPDDNVTTGHDGVPGDGDVKGAIASTVGPEEKTDMRFPMILNAPSGRLLPAAVIWSSTGVHTGGSVYSDLFVGLGDVAEFGLGVTDLMRYRPMPGGDPEPIQPFVQASFKMGVAEHQLFRHQPAIALSFRKSFQHQHEGAKVRTAGLYLVATKSFGDKFTVHAGGVMWDAALRDPAGATYFFHDEGFAKQIRPYGAIEVEPLPRSQILVELSWVPEFTRMPGAAVPAQAKLSALLAWGVRYRITTLFAFESGVRIQGIDEANLLDAQIFGQLSWGTARIRRAIHNLR